ncbi:MAG: hypothetical protein ACQXXF_07280 [Thermoplasmatota archaeon]|jgi:predicted RNA-binding Zn-ribbon protein involved in translation (DUF1610 family)
MFNEIITTSCLLKYNHFLIGVWVNIFLFSYNFYLLFFLLLIFLLTVFIILKKKKEKSFINIIKEFEKSLTGELAHFKCPVCNGIFAIKKSKGDNKKTIKLTCPDCGKIGVIPPNPVFIEEEIPEKKSSKVNFRCSYCGEGITIWAEGTNLFENIQVFSCCFCGKTNTMNKL